MNVKRDFAGYIIEWNERHFDGYRISLDKDRIIEAETLTIAIHIPCIFAVQMSDEMHLQSTQILLRCWKCTDCKQHYRI